jgi:hypothetical protein
VKPGNVLFDAHGVPRIGDFGIATLEADPSVTLTQAGAVIGTSGYIAPEQASGDGAVPASDQYALLAIAFEGLTGTRPFARDGVIAELAAHVSDPIPSASTSATGLPPAVDDVFRRALAKHPGDRFVSCASAIAALRDALGRVPDTVVTPAAPPLRTPPPRRGSSRRRIQLAVGSLLVLLALLLAFNAFGGDGDDQGDAPPATTEQQPADTEPPTTTTDTTPEPAPEPEPEPDPQPSAEQVREAAIERHLQSFAALEAGDYQTAYDLGIAALADLRGVMPEEAFANYNVGAALVGLGRCDEALPYLDRSEELQGQRAEIDAARAACTDGGPGNGKGKDKAKGKGKRDKGDD